MSTLTSSLLKSPSTHHRPLTHTLKAVTLTGWTATQSSPSGSDSPSLPSAQARVTFLVVIPLGCCPVSCSCLIMCKHLSESVLSLNFSHVT